MPSVCTSIAVVLYLSCGHTVFIRICLLGTPAQDHQWVSRALVLRVASAAVNVNCDVSFYD